MPDWTRIAANRRKPNQGRNTGNPMAPPVVLEGQVWTPPNDSVGSGDWLTSSVPKRTKFGKSFGRGRKIELQTWDTLPVNADLLATSVVSATPTVAMVATADLAAASAIAGVPAVAETTAAALLSTSTILGTPAVAMRVSADLAATTAIVGTPVPHAASAVTSTRMVGGGRKPRRPLRVVPVVEEPPTYPWQVPPSFSKAELLLLYAADCLDDEEYVALLEAA